MTRSSARALCIATCVALGSVGCSDAGPRDAGTETSMDASRSDAGSGVDAGSDRDSGGLDGDGGSAVDDGGSAVDGGAGGADGGRTEDASAWAADGGASRDAGTDSGMADAGPCEVGAIPSPPYTRLSETGGYADLAGEVLHPCALEFTPRHALWTDAAVKRRWMILPPGGVIDTSDPDHWIVPVGTRVFKQFARPGGRLETRLIQRVDDRGWSSDWWFGAFIWNAGRTEATLSTDGAENVLGTTHDVPSQRDCGTCHEGEPGRVLGFSSVQLSGASPLSLADAVSRGIFSVPPSASPVPGTAVERAALGYLHANCGHCHNPNGDAWRDTDLVLRVAAGESMVATTALYRSTVGVRTDSYRDRDRRITAGDANDSCVWYRMSLRDSSRWGSDQMPPLGTEIVDPSGLDAVSAWINSL